jgi:hypothetical protein
VIEEVNVEPGPDFPAVLYKYMSSDFVSRWLENETFMISSNWFFAQQYERMETKNDFINDPWEGVSVWRQDKAVTVHPRTSQEELDRVNQFTNLIGLGLAPGSSATLQKNVVQSVVGQFHMLCFSLDDSDETRRQFCTPDAGMDPPYDACLSIKFVEDFLKVLLSEGIIIHDGSEVPLREVYWGIDAEAVNYSPKILYWPHPIPESSAFHKDSKFSAQREYRIVFRRKIGQDSCVYPDRLLIRVPGLRRFLDIIF